MVATRNVTVKDGDVLLLVGTMKGAFLLRSNAARTRWNMGGPYFPGQAIYAMALDQRGGAHRLWAGGSSDHWGPGLRSSDDFGQTWTEPDLNLVKFPEDTGSSVARIWQVRPGRSDEPGVLYCGVEPAALFESRDSGKSWSLVRGLWDHPHRPQWQPGGGGMCLHTILPDPSNHGRITIAVSTGGVYRTDDSGNTWMVKNRGVRAEFMPDKHPEFGQCVHKVVLHPSKPKRLFLQNHWGLYRSDDGADSWRDIANGVPSDFGFAMAMHPHDPETVYILPIESDMYRCTPEGKLRVYRTRNGGASWEPLTKGLPQKNALECVLRDAMDTDRLKPAGVYFGTRRGDVWGSSNDGNSWRVVAGGLPPVVCVKAAIVGDPARVRTSKPAARAAKARSSSGARRATAGRRKSTTKRAAGARRKSGTTRGKRRSSGKTTAKRSTSGGRKKK